MFRLPAFFLLILLPCTLLQAQRNLSGTVIDVASGQPLAGASVFISNTSKGSVTDRNGFFALSGLPPGQQELVVSSIGYETNVFSFSAEKLPMKVKVEMQVKVKELENVMVERSVMEGWDKWGKLFTENFIGQTPNATKCRIKNHQSIRFRYFKKSNRLIAWSDEPLVVENKALGYTLRYQLENFEVQFKEHTTEFAGYPFFEDHHKDGKKRKNRWRTARDKAFAGSMMEFMRSVH
ncbi:MAG: carboxypeptidase-like regulatory domain-containing protein, partial [Chitinophagaceae bacterium]